MDSFDVGTAIIGSGFSGLGMAIRLKQEGIDDFTVLERGDDVGGTWHFNTYPGCACDVPSHLYSFSFAPNPGWSETYSRQPEIRDYLQRFADEYGVRAHVRLNCTVEGIEWDEDGGWTIATSDGPLRARVVVAGMGPLAEPKIPARSRGSRTSRARRSTPPAGTTTTTCTGKRVAAVGTGASAIQFVPEIQKQAAQVHVVQRTRAVDHAAPEPRDPRLREAPLRALPGAAEARARRRLRGPRAARARLRQAPAADEGWPRRSRAGTWRGRSPTRSCSRRSRPTTRSAASGSCPRTAGTARSRQPNVELLTGGVDEVTRNSVVTGDGEEREVDAIIFGTGFQVTDMPVGRMVRGPGGKTLDEVWQGSPKAHLGTAMPGFPNLFVLLGPNTGLGHSSMVYMIESQVAYVLDALRYMDRHGADTVQVRADAAERYNADLDERMEGTVWNTRLRELVPRRDRPQRDAVARLDVALPPADGARSTPPTSSSTTRAASTPEPVTA